MNRSTCRLSLCSRSNGFMIFLHFSYISQYLFTACSLFCQAPWLTMVWAPRVLRTSPRSKHHRSAFRLWRTARSMRGLTLLSQLERPWNKSATPWVTRWQAAPLRNCRRCLRSPRRFGGLATQPKTARPCVLHCHASSSCRKLRTASWARRKVGICLPPLPSCLTPTCLGWALSGPCFTRTWAARSSRSTTGSGRQPDSTMRTSAIRVRRPAQGAFTPGGCFWQDHHK